MSLTISPPKAPCPIGISILSVLHLLGGLIVTALGFAMPFVLMNNADAGSRLTDIGIPPLLLTIAILLIGLVGTAAAIGMWHGTRWGWYLATFYYVYSIVRNVAALFSVYAMFSKLTPEAVATMAHGPEFHSFKFATRTIIHTLIFFYFFKANVLRFFQLEDVDALKVILIEFGIAIAIAVALSIWRAALM